MYDARHGLGWTRIRIETPPRGTVASHSQCDSSVYLVRCSVWRAHLCNERHADYLGLPKDHPLRFGIDVGAEWDSHIALLHPDDHAEMRRAWSHCLRTGCPGEVSFRARDAEGGYRWFLSRVEPLRASDGTLLYWMGVTLDIEERKQAEKKLRRSETYLIESLADVKKSEDRLRLVIDSFRHVSVFAGCEA